MKILNLTISFLICTFSMNSQSLIEFAFPTEDGKILYKEVVKVDSTIGVKDLYINAKGWIAEKFKSSKDVLQLDNPDVLVVKGFIENGHNSVVKNPKKWFTLKLEFKEDRYRYILTDIIYEFSINQMGINQKYQEVYDDWLKYSVHKNKKKREKINKELEKYALSVNSEFELIIASLKNSMNKLDKSDEW